MYDISLPDTDISYYRDNKNSLTDTIFCTTESL